MELIIYNDGLYSLVEVTKEMLQNLKIYVGAVGFNEQYVLSVIDELLQT